MLFGVGLMATAGYLISRAAEQPAILSLTVAIVAVRFFALARPIARYFERLASHDLALRVLGRIRVRVYERIEPLAPVQLEGYRHGDLLSRMVADVDALQNLHLRGVGPRSSRRVAGVVSVAVTASVPPTAAIVLAVGLAVGRVARARGLGRPRASNGRPPGGRARGDVGRARGRPARGTGDRGLRPGGRAAGADRAGGHRAHAHRSTGCLCRRPRRGARPRRDGADRDRCPCHGGVRPRGGLPRSHSGCGSRAPRPRVLRGRSASVGRSA